MAKPVTLSAADLAKVEEIEPVAPAPPRAGGPITLTPEQLGQVEEIPGVSRTESFVRGGAQGAFFGFSDELTGFLESLFGPDGKTYRQARNESRAAYKAAEAANPKTYLAGELAGGVASSFVPGLNIGAGAKTVGQIAKTVGQIAKAGAKAGALAGLGASEAELLDGDVVGAAADAAKGAAVGGALGAAVGGAGKLVGRIARGAPERVDQRVVSEVFDKSLPSTRNAAGRLDDVATTLRDFELTGATAKDPSKLLPAASAARDSVVGQQVAGMQKAAPFDVGKALKVLEAERAALSKEAGTASKVAKIDKLVDDLKTKFLPPERLPDDELLETITKGSGKYAKKLGARKDRAVELLRQNGIDKVADDAGSVVRRGEEVANRIGEDIGGVYDTVKEPVTLGDSLKPLKALQKEINKDPARKAEAAAIARLADDMKATWAQEIPEDLKRLAQSTDADEAFNAAVAIEKLIDESPIDPRALRRTLTTIRSRGYESGSFQSPSLAKKFQRDVANALEEALDGHMEQYLPEDGLQRLKKLNNDYSIMRDVVAAAKEVTAKPGYVPAPRKTGTMTAEQAQEFVEQVLPEPYVKPTRKNQFERDLGEKLQAELDSHLAASGVDNAKLRAQERVLDQVVDAAEKRGIDAKYTPTGLRDVAMKAVNALTVPGLGAAGAAVSGAVGIPGAIGAGLAAKAGWAGAKWAGRKADAMLAKLVIEAQKGDVKAATRLAALEAGIPQKVVDSVIKAWGPKGTKKGDDRPKAGSPQAAGGGFDAWYAGVADRLGLDPDPDAKDHHYDYRAFYRAMRRGDVVSPDQPGGHFPSTFKTEGHPRTYLQDRKGRLFDTRTATYVDTGAPVPEAELEASEQAPDLSPKRLETLLAAAKKRRR